MAIELRVLFTFAAALTSLSAAQTPRSPLFAAVGPDEYFGEAYTNVPEDNASYVFFVGEPILLRITIANEQTSDLSLSQTSSDDVFGFELLSNGMRHRMALTCVVKGTDAGQPSPRSLMEAPVRLAPSQRLVWVCPVDEPIPPGNYRLRAHTDITDIDERPIALRVESLAFNLRAATPASRAEIVRREAMRHLISREPNLLFVEAAVQRLLKSHPTSSLAYLIRGHVQRLMGKETEALAAFGRALEILEREEDQLLLKFKGQNFANETKATVRRLIDP